MTEYELTKEIESILEELRPKGMKLERAVEWEKEKSKVARRVKNIVQSEMIARVHNNLFAAPEEDY